jgi:hypothetical protein
MCDIKERAEVDKLFLACGQGLQHEALAIYGFAKHLRCEKHSLGNLWSVIGSAFGSKDAEKHRK